MAPGATERWAKQYDKDVMATAHSIVGIPTTAGDRYDEQLQASVAAGGFGLTSSKLLAPAAFLAGVENTLRHSPVLERSGRVPRSWTLRASSTSRSTTPYTPSP